MMILEINEFISKWADKFTSLVDKITSNGTLASAITLVLFAVICIIVGNMANK